MPAPQLYKWDQWFRRKRLRLRRAPLDDGGDFVCSLMSMAQQIRNAAHGRGLSVNIEQEEDGSGLIVTLKSKKPAAVG